MGLDLRARVALGWLLLVIVNILWVGSSVLMQKVFVTYKFDKPIMTTVVQLGLCVVFMIPSVLQKRKREKEARGIHGGGEVAIQQGEDEDFSLALVGLTLGAIWFLSQLTFNTSLAYTSIALATVLASTSSFFTFFLALVVLKENFRLKAFLSVVAVFTGVALICLATDSRKDGNGHVAHHEWRWRSDEWGVSDHYGDDASSAATAGGRGGKLKETIRGDLIGEFLSVFSAFLFAYFTIELKRSDEKREKEIDMTTVFGWIGVWTCIFSPFVFIVSHLSGVEVFALPPFWTSVALGLNGLVGTVVSNYLWARAMILTSPLIATVGTSLSIPLSLFASMTVDANRKGGMGWKYLVGTFFVFGGVIATAYTAPPSLPKEESPPPLNDSQLRARQHGAQTDTRSSICWRRKRSSQQIARDTSLEELAEPWLQNASTASK